MTDQPQTKDDNLAQLTPNSSYGDLSDLDSNEEKVKVEAGYSSGGESDTETEMIQIDVPKSLVQYNLKPQVIGDNKILFYNAQDGEFYKREVSEPILELWLLTNKEEGFKLYSNKRFFEVAWRHKIQVRCMIVGKFDMIVSQEGMGKIYYDGKVIEKLPDVVIPRLGAGIDYYGMAVVRHLEKTSPVLVLNNSRSLTLSRDKLYTLQELASGHIPIPKTMIARFPLAEEGGAVESNFSYPIVLKKSSGSAGKGVMLINNQEHLADMGDMIDPSKPMILQEFISKSSGKDLRVIVVGGKVIGGMMRVAKKGFKANFHQGGYVRPVKLSAAVEWLAIECAKLVGLDIAGVDILIDHDSYKICEINASPGFQGFELATGIDVPQQIMEFVKLRSGVWKKTAKKPENKQVVMIPVEAEHIELNNVGSISGKMV
jgi:RimK family alpha-L-glutamate ligase